MAKKMCSSETKKSDSQGGYLKCCICQDNIDRNKCKTAKVFSQCGRTSHEECFHLWTGSCPHGCPGCSAHSWDCVPNTIQTSSTDTGARIDDEKIEELLAAIDSINSELQLCGDKKKRIEHLCEMHDELMNFFECSKHNDYD